MAGSLNKTMLLGNVGRDPEIRRTQDGRMVANLNLATSESWRDKNTGERKEHTEWHRVSILNEGLAGLVEKYVKKGSRIFVEGKLQTRKWTDQSGVEKYSTEVVLSGPNSQLTLMDSKPSEQQSAGRHSYTPGGTVRREDPISTGRNADMNDDIPF